MLGRQNYPELSLHAAVSADETFEETWSFRARYTNAPGFDMHYVDEGSGPETLLLLHGDPS